jgi:hypothetical protein
MHTATIVPVTAQDREWGGLQHGILARAGGCFIQAA